LTGSSVTFRVTGAQFGPFVALFLNGRPVAPTSLILAPQAVIGTDLLAEGRNDISLVAEDTDGRAISEDFVLWAGSRQLMVTVLDENGNPATNARLTARLGDDQTIVRTVDANGGFSFTNLPDRTVIVDALA